jgi:hypothetical protein
VSVAALREHGLSEAALARVVIIEFGSDDSSFDALMPEHYIIDGHHVPLRKVGPELL